MEGGGAGEGAVGGGGENYTTAREDEKVPSAAWPDRGGGEQRELVDNR